MSKSADREEWEVPHQPRKGSGSAWLMLVAAAVVILALIGLTQPMILRSHKAAERTEAISNAKQVGLALLEFDQEFGSFPDETTRELVLAKKETELDLSGVSSNAMLRQLVAYGVRSEDIFYCEHRVLPTHRPDNRMGKGQALAAGEVGFAYVVGLNSSSNPELPVLCASMIPETLQFDFSSLQQRAVVLRVDNTAKVLRIREEDGMVTYGGGELMLDTNNGLWPDGYVIDLRHPERP